MASSGKSYTDFLISRDSEGETPLHIVAKKNDTILIQALLEDGCDPCVLDEKDRVPFVLCSSKPARQAFISYREKNPNQWVSFRGLIVDGIMQRVRFQNLYQKSSWYRSEKNKGKNRGRSDDARKRMYVKRGVLRVEEDERGTSRE